MAVGRQGPDGPEVDVLARYCSWHGGFFTDEDRRIHEEEGAPMSHGCCPGCAEEIIDEHDLSPEDTDGV